MSRNQAQEKWESGLESLSKMISQEGKNLIPHESNLTKDIERTDSLWRYNTRKGIMLSSGGVERALFERLDIGNASTYPFNGYKNDVVGATTISSEEMKNFCKEEGLLDDATKMDELVGVFSFGSHEGFTRLARCIHSDQNKEMIYSVGGYGLLARAVATMNPTPYRVHLAAINRDNGEKIVTEDLSRIVASNPKAKTLYLEAKTMCGAIYNQHELEEIVGFCKERDVFFIYDTAHANMEFDQKDKFPDVAAICQKHQHEKFAVIFTGSKTYGLEKARVGFVILGGGEFGENLAKSMVREASRTHGSFDETPFNAAKHLILFPVAERQKFLQENRENNRFNMNLMIGYIEGVSSSKIDEDFRGRVLEQIPPEYQDGIEGLKLVHKPQGGIQLKANMSDLQNKYLTNIRMFNSEIFSYALQKMANVSTLNAYQIMDPEGFGLRLSFSSQKDVHLGMRATHDFVKSLTNEPTPNKFLPDVELAEHLIFPSREKIDQNIADSRSEVLELDSSRLAKGHKQNIENKIKPFSYIKLTEKDLDRAVDLAALKIQATWERSNVEKLKRKTASQQQGIVLKDL